MQTKDKRSLVKRQLQAFGRYRFLLQNLVMKDLKVKYRRSVLGILWSVLNPLLMMLVITSVFQFVFKMEIPNFPVYYLTGSLIYNFVSESTSGSMLSVVGAAPLIKKVYIPKYIFPMEKTLFSFINMFFSLIATAIVIVILGDTPYTWTMLLFPIPLLYTLVFAMGLGLILAALNVYFRDVQHLYSVWLTAWMYLTPIIYPLSILPGKMQLVVKCNPLYYYVDYFRQVVMYGAVPSLRMNLLCLGMSVGFLALGLWTFKKMQDRFILYI